MRRLLALAPLVLLAACGQEAGAIADDDTPAKATPEALVAVALDHLTPEPDHIELASADDEIDDQGMTSRSIGGLLRWDPDPDWTLSLGVEPTPKDFDPCDRRTCADLGAAKLSWQEPGDDAPGYLSVYVVRDGEVRSVGYESYGSGDPRKAHLAADLDELVAIVTDPRYALTTTQGAVDAGRTLRASLPQTKKAEREREKWEQAPVMTPRVLAAEVEKSFREVSGVSDVIASGREAVFREPGGGPVAGAWGIELTLRDQTRVHVTMLPEPDAASSGCQPTLRCRQQPESDNVLAVRADLGGVFRSDARRNVHIWVEGPRVKDLTFERLDTSTIATDLVTRELQAALATLPDDPAIAFKVTDETMIRAGQELTWFHD
jgi:hypothetical protein